MIQSARGGAFEIDSYSLLVEWRDAELRIRSVDAGELAGLPFPKGEVWLIGFRLEYQRNGEQVSIICKHPWPAPEDGEEGERHLFWRIYYRLRLRREGIYKLEARQGRYLPARVLERHYQLLSQDGELLLRPVSQEAS